MHDVRLVLPAGRLPEKSAEKLLESAQWPKETKSSRLCEQIAQQINGGDNLASGHWLACPAIGHSFGRPASLLPDGRVRDRRIVPSYTSGKRSAIISHPAGFFRTMPRTTNYSLMDFSCVRKAGTMPWCLPPLNR